MKWYSVIVFHSSSHWVEHKKKKDAELQHKNDKALWKNNSNLLHAFVCKM